MENKLTFNELIQAIKQVHTSLSGQAAKAVNISLTLRNWLIGMHIAEYEMRGQDKSAYGEMLIPNLSQQLAKLNISNCDRRQLYRYLKLYHIYPQIVGTLSPQSYLSPDKLLNNLSYSHFELLLEIDEPLKRAFYEIESIRSNWSVRELNRQIASLYFERVGLSKDKKKLAKLVQTGIETAEPALSIRDPYIFEFLGIKSKEVMYESALEDPLLDKLQDFLLEMGHGFCFESRQKRILIGGKHFFVDLVFYHRILKCHVLIELKVAEFNHEHLGQLNTYVSWFRKNEMFENDNPPIGLNKKRKRRIGSISAELINKSREATLTAVQVFNNPNITFKSETYVVLMIIAWTYLLHAYYRIHKIEYRYYDQKDKRKRFHRTKHGAYKYWELEQCLNNRISPIDRDTANNLHFLIGIRHEIEHQMTTRIDDILSAKFQACCLNYNEYIKKLFGDELGIENHLSFSLQFSSITTEQKEMLEEHHELPANIQSYMTTFDNKLSDEEFGCPKYAYRILFVPKIANRKGQSDSVIEFVKSDSSLANAMNKEYTIIKETEKKKYLPGQIVEKMKKEGYPNFSMHDHYQLWKQLDAKNSGKGYGTMVARKHWHWYERWLNEVRKQCKKNPAKYK